MRYLWYDDIVEFIETSPTDRRVRIADHVLRRMIDVGALVMMDNSAVFRLFVFSPHHPDDRREFFRMVTFDQASAIWILEKFDVPELPV